MYNRPVPTLHVFLYIAARTPSVPDNNNCNKRTWLHCHM